MYDLFKNWKTGFVTKIIQKYLFHFSTDML